MNFGKVFTVTFSGKAETLERTYDVRRWPH